METECKLMPTLEQRVLVYIATVLWNQKDVRILISEFLFSYSFLILEFWKEIEDKVSLKIKHLLLPQRLKRSIFCTIKPVGMQIFNWMMYHKLIFGCIRRMPDEFCWTSHGTIELKETAKLLINDCSVDRCKITYMYCLEDDSSLQNHNLGYRMYSRNYTYELERAISDGNEVKTRFFLQKLNSEDKEHVLVSYARIAIVKSRVGIRNELPLESFVNVLRILFISMNEKQQMLMYQNYSFYIMNCFLLFPWQNYFLVIANRAWPFLCAGIFYNMLWMIIDKIYTGYKDYNYQMLFIEFWQQGPVSFKKYAISHCARRGGLLPRLFKLRDKELIKLLLMEANTEEKEKLIFQKNGRDICGIAINNNKWSLLKLFLQECLVSKEAVIIFKECYFKKGFFGFVGSKELDRRKEKFGYLLDHLIQKLPKTSLEEDYHLAMKYHQLELNGMYLGSEIEEDSNKRKPAEHKCKACQYIQLT